MGFATYDNYGDTSTWAWWGTAGNNTNYFRPVSVVEAVVVDKLADLPYKAWNAIRLAGLRPPPRATSEMRPPAHVPRTRPVRRELQRAGTVGFARLGGRRPL